MEIERKYILPPTGYSLNGCVALEIEQSYISVDPVIRLRRTTAETTEYALQVKGDGAVVREEFELQLDRRQYESLLTKIESRVIRKTRYLIPLADGHTAEADIYHGQLDGLRTVEVEFESEEDMNAFTPPEWFGRDVSEEREYKNSALATGLHI